MDLNLLVALDALLAEGSVAGAARRMNLSAPAMSRTLARIRDAVGDPVLVRAGRRLVPTPRAIELRDRVRAVVEDAQALLRPEGATDPSTLERTFTIRASDYAAGVFSAGLAAAAARQAPGVTLRFTDQGREDVKDLREGRIDLDIGVLGSETGPEIRVQTLLQDRFVGVVREGHPLLRGAMTAERFAAAPHISASRRGRSRGLIDDALERQGLSRRVTLVMPSFYAALFTAASSDIVAALPLAVVARAAALGLAVRSFELPVTVPTVTVVQSWHPRFDKDAGHRWLRQLIKATIGETAERR
ncbi:LysR family transcriptional regulator [Inquilinus sp. Marseille-Q2685]|uniref:LysR family transcriptional regulator n=1 Tax=Inquilinus sp. Marseille-Q2685 TaxID=2866581 RepID=UPI0027E18B04|nr:LysR family transcriptional regulator [Inquilinus sp. Marseille-Q2685]